jgi:hypothetical protein
VKGGRAMFRRRVKRWRERLNHAEWVLSTGLQDSFQTDASSGAGNIRPGGPAGFQAVLFALGSPNKRLAEQRARLFFLFCRARLFSGPPDFPDGTAQRACKPPMLGLHFSYLP